MDVSGDYVFDAPQALVWHALQDPNILGSVMPGGKGFEQTGENQYSGVLEVKVGPVQGTFQGRIQLVDVVAPTSYSMDVDGKGAAGFVKANGRMRLEARDGQTFMEYSGTAQVGGRIASVGQRLMDSAARSIIRQTLDALNAYLQTEAAASVAEEPANTNTPLPASPPPPAAYKPPSQMALAFNVARDVLNDILPPRYQPWALGAVIAVIVLLVLTSR